MTENSFEGRIALVTGASRGLGYALARELGSQGAHVLALARTVGGLEELDEEIQAAGGSTTLIPLDLTDDPALERMGAAVHERWGKLDLWAHTAISAPPLSPVEHTDAKDLDKVLSINIRAVQRLIRVLDPLLRQSDAGRVLHFADLEDGPRPYHANYLAGKAASETLITSWKHSLESVSNVRVIGVKAPPMPTALRLRFHPGEDTTILTEPAVVAKRLVANLAKNLDGPFDLRD